MDVKSDKIIEGISIRPLKIIKDERGAVMHMLRNDSPEFTQFGEVYFSLVHPGVVKAWKYHKKASQHFAVPTGKIKLVVLDNRSNSKSVNCINEIIMGRPSNYFLVTVPPMVWYGFQNISDQDSILTNCADIAHMPEESLFQKDIPHGFEYCW